TSVSVGRSHDATSRTSAIDRATHMPSQRTDGANGYEAMYNSGSGRLEEMTIILVMTETLALAQVKARFSELADRVESEHDRIVVTRNGRPVVVLVSPDDLESLEETLAIVSRPALMTR